MEIIAVLFTLFIVIAQFVEGFAAINLIQFFRGKETPLEKLVARRARKKTKQEG